MTTTERQAVADQKRALTVPRWAKLHGMSKNLAYAGIHDGSIPHFKVGGRYFIPVNAMAQMVEKRQIAAN